MMPSPSILCYDCIYFHTRKSRTCEAFPEKIPDEIWSGTFIHNKPFPGDQGIQFKPKLQNDFLSVTKVAKLFKVDSKTIYRALWDRRLSGYKIGKIWRIAKKDLEQFKKKSIK